MKKNLIILFAVSLFTLKQTGTAAQQGELRMTAGIVAGVPMGGLKDLAGKTSLRGADIALLYGVNDKISVGLNIGYQDFYEKFPRQVYKLDDGSDISAVMTNSIQHIPILASFRYNFLPGGTIQPYAAAGVGGTILFYRQFLGEYPSSDDKFSLAARPELGLYIPFRRNGLTGFNLGVQYTFVPYKRYGIDNMDYLGIKIGIGFPLRD